MHYPHIPVPPDPPVHLLPPHSLQRVVHVRQRDPRVPEDGHERVLVGEDVGGSGGVAEVAQDQGVVERRGAHDQEATVGHVVGEVDGGWGCGGEGWSRVLGCVGAGGGGPCCSVSRFRWPRVRGGWRMEGRGADIPVLGVVRLVVGIADAGMARGEHPAPGLHPTATATASFPIFHPHRLRRIIQRHVQQRVQLAPHEHIAIQQAHDVKLLQPKHHQLRPRVREARVVAVVRGRGGEEGVDGAGADAAAVEGGEARGGEGGGRVEGDERVGGASCVGEGVVQEEEAGEVVQVGY